MPSLDIGPTRAVGATNTRPARDTPARTPPQAAALDAPVAASPVSAGQPPVDAERVAQLMNVTLRTARRTLQNLVQAGLAWPMPPPRSKKVGRPPMLYQLLNERLDP